MKIKNEIQYEKVVSCKIVQDNTEQGMPDSTAETIMVTSIGTYRDTIYSTALTMIENEGTTLSKTVKFASSLGIALPFTAIGIAMDSKNEGAVQATITGLLTTGAVVAISFVAIGILPSTIPAAIAVGILSGFSNYIIGKMFDNIYDFSENLYWNWKYEQETKKLIIETSETDISDIKTMVDFIVNTKDTKKHLYNIEIKQNKNGETIIYTIQPSDTIWDICNNYDIPEDTLKELNPWLPDRYSDDGKFALIKPGEKLKLPNDIYKEFNNLPDDFPNYFDTAIISEPQGGDPILLDLNGDGIKTVSVENGINLDHQSDGFAEKSAWVSNEDGILFIDKNNNEIIDNGSELFGENYVKSDGTNATTGFNALADLDSNNDSL